jgi:hypothetical protein
VECVGAAGSDSGCSARAGAWPGFVNIPSRIGQVAAVRTLAGQRREQDTVRGILLAAICPGMMNTTIGGAST